MGALESMIFGALAYFAYKKVVKPTISFRRKYRRKLKYLEKEKET